MRDRRRFGQAVALDDTTAGDRFEVTLDLGRERRRPADAGLDARQVVLADVGMVGKRLVHDRRAGEEPRTMLRRLEHHLRVEARDEDQRAADEHREVHVDGEAVDVEERQRAQDARTVAVEHPGEPRRNLDRVGDEVSVREHRELGCAGRATGRLQHGGVVG